MLYRVYLDDRDKEYIDFIATGFEINSGYLFIYDGKTVKGLNNILGVIKPDKWEMLTNISEVPIT